MRPDLTMRNRCLDRSASGIGAEERRFSRGTRRIESRCTSGAIYAIKYLLRRVVSQHRLGSRCEAGDRTQLKAL